MPTGSGARLGPYVLGPVIGSGGMGEVYRAHDSRLGRDVAIKILPPDVADDPERLRRFESEARAAAALNHPNILVVHDVGREHDTSYLVTELLEGRTLRAEIDAGPVPLPRAVDYAVQIAEGLAAAHARGIVHRDLKPENVFVTTDGRVKILDFGLAKTLHIPDAAATTVTGVGMVTGAHVVLGTPGYMAPEQVRGEPVDHRADIFAFGCVLYELLGGRRAFGGGTTLEVLSAILRDTPAPLASLSPALARIVERCLEKEPAARFQSVRDLAFALRGLAGSARVPRRRVALALTAAVLALTGAWWGRTYLEPSSELRTTSIAVMPFANLSDDPSNDYFGEGLAEEITGALVRGGLQVIGRGSVRALAARGMDAREVGHALRVPTVLQGTVQRSGERVRISVMLLNAGDGGVMWTERFDRRLDDIFAIQDEIARSVAARLQTTLAVPGRSLVRQETADPEAHSLYLQGLYLWNRRTASSVYRAIDLFEQAVARDSSYGRAHAGIALGKAVLPFYADVETKAVAEEAKAAARRALDIDEMLAEAWAVLGIVNAYEWKADEAADAFRRALSIDSSLATARFWLGLHLIHRKRFQEAFQELETAQNLDPLSLVNRVGHIILRFNQRRYAEAEAIARQVLTDDPTFALARYHLASILADSERHDEAIAILSSMDEVPGVRASEVQSTLAYALAHAGRVRDARGVIDRLRQSPTGHLPPTAVLASALLQLGDRDTALVVLKNAIDQHDPMIMLAAQGARLDQLRADPAGDVLLRVVERR
jgi:eukaryotic-like serine/threonine-protein kinase